jgi:hypothetical protein
MLSAAPRPSRFMTALFTLLFIAAFGLHLRAQDVPAIHVGDKILTGIPDDWTHHRVVFSDPGTEEDAIKNGTHEQWLKVVNDPRYILHQLKRGLPARGSASDDVDLVEHLARADREERRREDGPRDRNWTQHGAGSKGQASTLKKDWNEVMGAATAPSNVATPAKWTFSISTASCANDFVVYPTGQAGATGRASIIAYYNNYTTGCGAPVPETDWAYNTGGTVALSPIFSLGGNELAFIQTVSGVANLVLLRIPLTPPGTGTITAPVAPNTATTASNFYTGTGCATPCMFQIALNGNPGDTVSDPYYDYGTDTLYVGDSTGKLHKFTPVFNAAPAEVTASWPAQLKRGATNDTNQTASPVYDGSTGYVLVGTTDPTGTSGGYLYSVGSGNLTTTSGAIHGYSGQLDNQYGIRDAPILDSSAGMVYVFAGNDTKGNNGVFQFANTFTTGSGTEVTVGRGGIGATAYQFDGTFDNTYYTSPSSTSPSGYLYMCSTGAPATLYQIPINANVMGTAVTGPSLADSGFYGRCSPITEFLNPSVGGTTTATGTITINTNPAGWAAGQRVIIGATTYTFETTLSGTNQVLLVASGFFGQTTNNEDRTAQNLYATVNGSAGECYTAGCLWTGTGGQPANASVTATQTGNVVTLTSKTAGLAGNFTLSTTSGDFTVSGGSNGTTTTGTDYLFLSVYIGNIGTCTDAVNNGCVMSFDVTTPASFGTGLTPRGTDNISAPTSASPTGGISIDNGVSSPAGTSQIYYLTQDTAGTSPCAGICAVQDSQSAP